VTGPAGEPPLEALPPDAPATVEDVRAGRRWTWVALAWAIAASAIGVIALVQAGKDNNANDSANSAQQQTAQDVATQLKTFEQQVNDRLDAFSRRLNDTASAADLQKLDKRLSQTEDDVSKVQDDVSKQSDAITQIQSDIKDLQQRVSDLENQQSNGNQGTSTTP